jgi:hypothetical protein
MSLSSSESLKTHDRYMDSRVNIRFTIHEQASDVVGLRSMLSTATVYMPEVFSWLPKFQPVFQEVADGSLNPGGALSQLRIHGYETQYAFHLARFRELYQTGVHVVMLDVPFGHPIERANNFLWCPLVFAPAKDGDVRLKLTQSFDEVLTSWGEYKAEYERLETRREEYMAENILTQWRTVKGKILPELGVDHVHIIDSLHVLGFKMSYEVPEGFSDFLSIAREKRERLLAYSGNDREFIGRLLLEELIHQSYKEVLYAHGVSLAIRQKWYHEAAWAFPLHDIQHIWTMVTTKQQYTTLPLRPILNEYTKLPPGVALE